MATQSAEQVRSECINRMGEPLGVRFHALWQEVAWIHAKWEQYVELFGSKPTRIDLLNRAAPFFFRVVQDSLWEDIILHIARLTDPPRTGTKENLTIRLLPELAREELRGELVRLVDTSTRAAGFCRDWRNRRIAHRDLHLAIESGMEPLKPASRASIKEALCSIVSVLNSVTSHYMDSTTMFGRTFESGGALSLLYVVDDGLRAEAERGQRIRSGTARKGDFEVRDL